MKMLTITREFIFDSAHRLFKYDGKCANIHGHTYKLIVEFTKLACRKLDDQGMIVDFGVIKELVTKYLEKWDHTLILNENDPLLDLLDKKVNLKVMTCNPTVENMVQIIARDLMYETYRLKQEKNIDIVLQSVTLYETPTCYATFSNFHQESENSYWGKNANK